MNWLDQIINLANDQKNEIPEEKVLTQEIVETKEEIMEEIKVEATENEVEAITEIPVEVQSPIDYIKSISDSLIQVPPEVAYHHKGMRYKLVCEGVCTHCAHCGQPLTDAESTQRGIGPICSKKGYADEVEAIDPMDAMIALAQYPQLVDYLNAKYKPHGNRGLANGLVRTASLNRRTPVHSACTDALDALGYKKLASALRESLAVVEVYDSKNAQDCFAVWVKKSDFDWNFYRSLTALQGVRMLRFPQKELVVPKVHRIALAQSILKYYEGLCVKTAGGAHKISPEWFGKSSGSASA